MSVTATAPDLLRRVEAWVYREARLADEHDYDGWEALWDDQATYWVPANGDDTDPTASMSILYDNRSRIATRIRQLKTGRRHSQRPRSSLRRLITNVEVLDADPVAADVHVGANFAVFEAREPRSTTWAGRYEYHLVADGDSWRMRAKTVLLVGNDQPLPTLSFLI
jgi:3-phenylpropionate/cinnamic acid dioxygenase small subunit